MTESIALFKQALWLVVMLSAPPLLVATLLGVATSLLQALTQIQDQTLPYVIKLVSVSVTLLLTGRWIGSEVIGLCVRCMDLIAGVGR